MSGPLQRLKSAFGPVPYDPLTSADWDDRFTKAILFSAMVHTVFIFGLQFQKANPGLFENQTPPIDVVLVNAKSKDRPLKADVLAQHNLMGGGTVEENLQASSPLPVSPHDQPMSAEAEMQARVQALEERAKALMQQAKSSYQVPDKKQEAEAEPRPPTPEPAPADLAQRSIEMAKLQARVDQQWSNYQKRPRRGEFGINAQGYSFAQYVDDWRIKVERVGNVNYPEAARRQGLYGSLILTVNINSDGSLQSVEIYKSSGSKILDAAATKIVEMAAPFPAFSPEMRKQVDILGITRTWTFTRADQLTSQ